jgi:hypothetical protein
MTDPLKEVMSGGFAAPLGDVIASVGRGVADAQAALDRASLEATLSLYESDGDAGTAMLREIGYRPTFYVLPETSCEVQISLRVGGSSASDGSANAAPNAPRLLQSRAYATPVDAGFANRFGYEASASAKLTFKIVPVPPPLAFDEQRPVPTLTGRTVAETQVALDRLGFTATFQDPSGKVFDKPPPAASVVLAQSPAPFTLAPIGGTIIVTIPP